MLHRLAHSPDGVTVRMIAQTLECDDNTASRELQDLKAIGFAKKTRPAKTDIFLPSTKLLDYATQIMRDGSEPPVTLQKLFDLPNNLISEGEEGRGEV